MYHFILDGVSIRHKNLLRLLPMLSASRYLVVEDVLPFPTCLVATHVRVNLL